MLKGKLTKGQVLTAYPGADHNLFHDAAAKVFGTTGQQQGTGASGRPVFDTVLVRNDSGAARARGEMLALDEPLRNPVDDTGAEAVVYDKPVFKGIETTESRQSVCILLSDLNTDAIGVAVVMGICWAKVQIDTDGDDTCGVVVGGYTLSTSQNDFEILWPLSGETGETDCLIKMGGGSGTPIRRAVTTTGVTAPTAENEAGSVTVQPKKPDAEPNQDEWINDGGTVAVEVWADFEETETGLRCVICQDSNGRWLLLSIDCAESGAIGGPATYEVPGGGTNNQILAKASGADGDFTWVNNSGTAGDSAYDVAVANGFVGNETAWLASLVGADGADGADGAAGATGADGDSAYDVAVANGFVGDEAAWLTSLEGQDGQDGADGAQGPAGADGAQGPQGPAGADGADGQGVPAGGTAGQVLEKIDGTDYNTQWADGLTANGTPVAGRVAFWNGATELSHATNFTLDGTDVGLPGDLYLDGTRVISVDAELHNITAIDTTTRDSVEESARLANLQGNLPVSKLNGGTAASSSTFWRGDGTWAAPAGGGASVVQHATADISGPGSVTGLQLVTLTNASNTTNITWNTTTHRVTVDAAGIYQLEAHIAVYSTTQRFQAVAKVYKNGVALSHEHSGLYIRNSGLAYDFYTLSFPLTLTLAANDYLEVYVDQRTGSSWATSGTNAYSVQGSGRSVISLLRLA